MVVLDFWRSLKFLEPFDPAVSRAKPAQRSKQPPRHAGSRVLIAALENGLHDW
jgi:hypothetical protein